MSNEVEINEGDIFWKITPAVRLAENDGVLVELRWGWTAGMTDEERADCADDAPQGYDSVTTNVELATELRDDLTYIIEKLKS